MRPDNNPNIYKVVAAPTLVSVHEEFMRRNLLSAHMKELAELFGDREHTTRPVADPTIIARLLALSAVQRSQIGITGFDPMGAIDRTTIMGRVEAKAAPHHDEFIDPEGNTYRTRIIRLLMPDSDLDDTIDVLGLNFYQPDLKLEGLEPDGSGSNGLVVVNTKGLVIEENVPVTGDTTVFAVRERLTGDAKIYSVSLDIVAMTTPGVPPGSIVYETPKKVRVALPDQVVVLIEQLKGDLEREALLELQSGIDTLKKAQPPAKILAEEEKAAIRYLQY